MDIKVKDVDKYINTAMDIIFGKIDDELEYIDICDNCLKQVKESITKALDLGNVYNDSLIEELKEREQNENNK